MNRKNHGNDKRFYSLIMNNSCCKIKVIRNFRQILIFCIFCSSRNIPFFHHFRQNFGSIQTKPLFYLDNHSEQSKTVFQFKQRCFYLDKLYFHTSKSFENDKTVFQIRHLRFNLNSLSDWLIHQKKCIKSLIQTQILTFDVNIFLFCNSFFVSYMFLFNLKRVCLNRNTFV